ncbi:MAG: uroporphyrinogen-III C-methyltransferase [Acidobacteriota bacterium]
MTGCVALVGAGPGDPDLLTRAAVRCLRRADLVLHDELVDPQVLRFARQARCVQVGKRGGRRSTDQALIEKMMIRAARRGRYVVRLKGGDPVVLGRGGEEMVALAHAGIPCEVIPGVTAAVAAPELAGIPLTRRGVASGFVVVSGHARAAYEPILAGLAPGRATIVVLMGRDRRGPLRDFLLLAGWPRSTPVAIVSGAASKQMFVSRGELHDLARLVLADPDLAATIVIGEVVTTLAARSIPLPPPRALVSTARCAP